MQPFCASVFQAAKYRATEPQGSPPPGRVALSMAFPGRGWGLIQVVRREPQLQCLQQGPLESGNPDWIYFLKDFIYLFLESGEEGKGEREGEKHQCVVASHTSPTGDLARNPGIFPDWEPNL